MHRRATPAQTKRSLKCLIDEAAGHRIDRRELPEAIVVVGSATLPALMKAFQRLRRREDDHLRVGAIIAQIGRPGMVAEAQAALARLDQRHTAP
jgi:hypothetical protein